MTHVRPLELAPGGGAPAPGAARRPRRWALLFAAVLVPVSLAPALRWAIAIVRYRRTGIDVSDEGLYLLSARHPDVTAAVSDFGFHLRFLRNLSGGTIGGLRVAGLVCLLGASALAAVVCDRLLTGTAGTATARSALTHPTRWLAGAVVFGLTSSAMLTFYGLWLPTPGYNLLGIALDGVCVSLLTLGLAGRLAGRPETGPVRRWPWIGAAAVGVQAAVLKPTSALAIAAVYGIAGLLLLRAPRRRVIEALVSGALLGLVVNVVLVGSPLAQLRRFLRGRSIVEQFSIYTPSAIWELEFLRRDVGPWLRFFGAVCALAAAGAWLLRRRPALVAAAASAAQLATAIRMWPARPRGGGSALFAGLAGWWWLRFTLFALLWVLVASPGRRRYVGVSAVAAVSAVATTIGTANGFIRLTALMWGLYFLGILFATAASLGAGEPSAAEPGRVRIERVLSAGPMLIVAGLSTLVSWEMPPAALREPYRIASSLDDLDVDVSLASFGRVRTAAEIARYFAQLTDLGERLPRDARDCIVDLAGGSPIATVLLGGRPAATNWLVGGYPESAQLAQSVLDDAGCLRGPVVVIESDGPRRIDPGPLLAGRTRRLVGRARLEQEPPETQTVWWYSARVTPEPAAPEPAAPEPAAPEPAAPEPAAPEPEAPTTG